eukprot:5147057-Karenia_brevis.AAC.1
MHPRLCKLLHLTVTILLYADDAAIPADSEEDLQLAAEIFEQYCNEHHLFISVPKTVVTVFHPVSSDAVQYSDGSVFVHGRVVDVRIYGQTVRASASFKYLG